MSSLTLRVGRLVATLVLLASCDSGGGGSECTPGTDPMPGCSLGDCQAGRNTCGGTVYACDQAGNVFELGTCDLSHPDAGTDAGIECIPGTDPVPECSSAACAQGVNACGGQIFACDSTGHSVVVAFCDFPQFPVDAAVAPADAEVVVDADVADAGTMEPGVDAAGTPGAP
jgi:hypothetical protein